MRTSETSLSDYMINFEQLQFKAKSQMGILDRVLAQRLLNSVNLNNEQKKLPS